MKRRDDNDMSPFGKKLVRLRQGQGMRQQDLAEALAVSRATVSYYESRAKTASTEFVQKVAEHFGLSTDELLREDNSSDSLNATLERQLHQIQQLPERKRLLVSKLLGTILLDAKENDRDATDVRY